MSDEFSFSADQIDELAHLLGDEKYVPAFKRMVVEFRANSRKHKSQRDISEHVESIAKLSQKLLNHISALQRECGRDAAWIVEPLELCGRYAQSLFDYQYSDPLPAGRPREWARTHLIQTAASYWRYVLQREPLSRSGEFPTLVQNLLSYSGVTGAEIENLEELIDRAMQNCVALHLPGPDYPFEIDMDMRAKLPQPRRAAEDFFSFFVLSPQEPAWPKRANRSAKKQMGRKK